MTLTIKDKKVRVKPMKDKDGNAGYFIPSKEWKYIKKLIPSAATKNKPSVFNDVKEALKEVKLIEEGKMKALDAKSWIKNL